ncbi:MAG: N-methyl-L-tryptophan oxidase, partial [Pseudomonadota bacterium]
MTPNTFDVAVVGMGAMGAATLAALSKTGLRIIGIDQFSPPHDQGSSHGETRLLRTAYAEDKDYVPLVLRAIELWDEYKDITGDVLFEQTGVVYGAREPSELLTGIRDAADQHGVAIQEVAPADRRDLMPQLSVPDDWKMIYERDGGFVHAERAVSAMLGIAAQNGATLSRDEAVKAISKDGSGHLIRTSKGEYRAQKVVVCAGGWITNLIPELAEYLHLQRRVLHWFKCEPNSFTQASKFKPFCVADRGRWVYGFPDVTGGQIKVADHHASEYLDSIETINRDTT